MKLSDNTLKILSNYSAINNGICIRASKSDDGTNVSTVGINNEIYSSVTLPEVFDKDVYLYDLGLLLGSLKSFENPTLELSDDFLTIKDGAFSLRLLYADPTTIKYPEKSPKLPDEVLSFNIPEKSLGNILKFSNMLASSNENSYIKFYKDGEDLFVSTVDKDTESSNKFKVNLGAIDTDAEFSLLLNSNTLKLIPADYEVTVHMLQANKLALKFTNVDSPFGLSYIIPCNPDSNWN